jgi:hypothetical protein
MSDMNSAARSVIDAYDKFNSRSNFTNAVDLHNAINLLRVGLGELDVDRGPQSDCLDCRGTGRCDNAQFSCRCRWSHSFYRKAPGEREGR